MGKVEGRIKVPVAQWTATVGAGTATITTGTYYMSSAGSGASDFLQTVADAFATAGATTCSITASLGENGTGIVTITFGVAKAIAWIDTELRDLLGFTADSASATSHVSTRSARSVWLPSCAFMAPDIPSDNFKGLPFTDNKVVTNKAGYAWHVAGQMHYQLPIEWPAVSAAKTRISQESTVNQSYERFWRDHVFGSASWAKPGGPVRLYPNAATDTTYVEYRVLEPLGSFEPQALLESLPTGPHRVAMRLIAIGDDPTDVVSAAITAPTYQATGTEQSSISAITVAWPTHVAGDVALLLVTTLQAEAATLTTANGFVQVTDTPITGTSSNLSVFWCRATSGAMASPVVADAGNYQLGVIVTFRGCVASGDPVDVSAPGTAASSTSVSVPGDISTQANDMVVAICSGGTDVLGGAQFSAWANANLASVTEIVDVSTDVAGGGILGAACGVKATAGAYGATTATLATASAQCLISIALKGA